MAKRITIKDIARELDVHHSTVSRALHNDSRVNKETRRKILDFAASYGYRVNINALQLRGSIRKSIALIIPNIRHAFFTNIISHLTHLAHQNDYVISVFESNENSKQEEEVINTIIQYNFAGVIASIAKDTKKSDHFRLLADYDIPLVFFDRVCEDMETPKVLVNNYKSAFDAVEMMIIKGYQRIAFVNGPVHLNVFRDRQKGYQDALRKYKRDYHNHLVISDDFSIEEGKNTMDILLDKEEKPDAILSSSALLTIGILVRAKEMELSIPGDLALIGFGDTYMAEILEPGINSIIQPEERIAVNAFKLILHLINEEEIDPLLTEKLETSFVERNSV